MQVKTSQSVFVLDIDDYGLLLPGNEDILRIKQHYENFKITCFTIPFPKEFFLKENWKHFTKEKYQKWAEIVNSYDWMEIAIHGFSHTTFEFDCPYNKANEMLDAIENLWKEVGLKYKKIFKAPYWQYSYDSLVALKERGYIVAIDRNFPRSVPEGLQVYVYNWSFEEKIPNVKIIKGHGHAYAREGTKNPIGECYQNIISQIPEGAQFKFISELAPQEMTEVWLEKRRKLKK